MKVPPEITFRDVPRTPRMEASILKKIAKLEKSCDYISSCSVAIERPNAQTAANLYRVRVSLRVPPGHEIVGVSDSGRSKARDPLPTLLRQAFAAAQSQLDELVEKERREVKLGSYDEKMGLINRVFWEEGYGFIQAFNGDEIYFHRNSVLNRDFERLRPGTGVRFHLESGEKGPQASSVQVVDRPGARAV